MEFLPAGTLHQWPFRSHLRPRNNRNSEKGGEGCNERGRLGRGAQSSNSCANTSNLGAQSWSSALRLLDDAALMSGLGRRRTSAGALDYACLVISASS